MNRQEWFAQYSRIWSDHDFSEDLIARLFTEDAIYRPNVLPTIEQTCVGHHAILGYMKRVVPTLAWEGFVKSGLIESGDQVVLQAWLWGKVEGRECTEVICSVYRFAVDGRCCEIRDFPQITDSIVKPFPGWAD